MASNPTNVNFLSSLKFSFNVSKLPATSFFVQAVTLPNIQMGQSRQPTPLLPVPIPGDTVDFGEMVLTFRVDEDMNNYFEIFDWIMGLGFPRESTQYEQLQNSDVRFDPTGTPQILSDMTLSIMNSNLNTGIEIKYIDAFPTSLTDLLFDTRQPDVDYVECSATFSYARLEYKRVS